MRTWRVERDASENEWAVVGSVSDYHDPYFPDEYIAWTIHREDAQLIADALNEKEQRKAAPFEGPSRFEVKEWREAEDAVYVAKGEIGGFVYDPKARQYRRVDAPPLDT